MNLTTSAARQAAKVDIDSELSKYSLFDTAVWSGSLDKLTQGITLDAAFSNAVDADTVYSKLVTVLLTNNKVVSGDVSWHDCTHDDVQVQPCIIPAAQKVTK
jgi:hypothetical protein